MKTYIQNTKIVTVLVNSFRAASFFDMYYSFETCIGDANVTLTWAFKSGPVRTNNLQSVLF